MHVSVTKIEKFLFLSPVAPSILRLCSVRSGPAEQSEELKRTGDLTMI